MWWQSYSNNAPGSGCTRSLALCKHEKTHIAVGTAIYSGTGQRNIHTVSLCVSYTHLLPHSETAQHISDCTLYLCTRWSLPHSDRHGDSAKDCVHTEINRFVWKLNQNLLCLLEESRCSWIKSFKTHLQVTCALPLPQDHPVLVVPPWPLPAPFLLFLLELWKGFVLPVWPVWCHLLLQLYRPISRVWRL